VRLPKAGDYGSAKPIVSFWGQISLKKIDRAKARDYNIRKYAKFALESWGLAKQRMNSQLTPLTFTPGKRKT